MRIAFAVTLVCVLADARIVRAQDQLEVEARACRELIADIATTMSRPADNESHVAAVARLRSTIERERFPPDVIVTQWLEFFAERFRAGDHPVGHLAEIVLAHMSLADEQIVAGLAPHMSSQDPEVQSLIAIQLSRIEGIDSAEEWSKPGYSWPGFQAYEDFIGPFIEKDARPPKSFIVYLLTRSPSNMLRVFCEAQHYGGGDARDILLAEHVVTDALWYKDHGYEIAFAERVPEAQAQLAFLAKRHEWWARVYAAEILCSEFKLRDEALVELLSRDPDKLVKERMTTKATPQRRVTRAPAWSQTMRDETQRP